MASLAPPVTSAPGPAVGRPLRALARLALAPKGDRVDRLARQGVALAALAPARQRAS